MARIQHRWWRVAVTTLYVAVALAHNSSALAQATSADASSENALDSQATHCWALSADPLATTLTQQNVHTHGSGASCALVLALSSMPATNVSVGQALQLTWVVTTRNATALAALLNATTSSRNAKRPLTVVHSAIHLCDVSSSSGSDSTSACNPLSTAFQKANESASQRLDLTTFADRDSMTFASEGEVAFAAPGNYTLAAYVVVAGARAGERFDFVTSMTVTVSGSGSGSDMSVRAIADNDHSSSNATSNSSNNNGLPLGISTSQLVMVCALFTVIVGCVAVAVVLVTRRRRRALAAQHESSVCAKASHTAALSPGPEASQQSQQQPNLRLSDWSEIYATQDALPRSILTDDRTTIAILRASRVSSPVYSERKVADFTRDVGYWDVRPSASPITPLASFFFPSVSATSSVHEEGDVDNNERYVPLSPTDSFQPLESLGRRRTRPCHPDALDDQGLYDDGSNDDDDVQEFEF